MALMELTIEATYVGQTVINRFNYIASGSLGTVSQSFGLVAAFGAIYNSGAIPPGYPGNTVLSKIMSLLSSGVILKQILCRNVYSNTDFYETPFLQSYTGSVGGEGMPPFAAYGLYTNRIIRNVRRGQKRFAGVVEAYANAGQLIDSAKTTLAEVAAAMSTTLQYDDEGITYSYQPCIAGKERYIPENSTKPAYRYYEDPLVQEENTAVGVSWAIVPTVRSQVSRQYARGK